MMMKILPIPIQKTQTLRLAHEIALTLKLRPHSRSVSAISVSSSSTVSSNIETTPRIEVKTNYIRERKRQCKRLSNSELVRSCNAQRTEEIHQALAKMVALNQMPISFCSSLGFKQFMNVVEPNYKPCSAGTLF